MKKIITIVAIFATIFAFVSFAAQNKRNGLHGKWILVSYGKKGEMKKPVQFEPFNKKAVLTFAENKVSFSAGRGSLGMGEYSTGKKNKFMLEKFEIAKFKLTEPFPSEDEKKQNEEIMKLFKTAKSFRIRKNQLMFHCEDDTMLIFEKKAEKEKIEKVEPEGQSIEEIEVDIEG